MMSTSLLAPSRQAMRLHSSTSLSAALALTLLLLLTASPPAEAGWKAGLAKSDLTPRAAVWLAGYGSRRVATDIIHPLWMKALALDDGQGHRVVLITSDFQGVPKGMSDRVFQQVKQKYRLERDQVMYTFSHNHCGPRLGEDLIDYYPVEEAQEELVRRYTDKMVTVSVELIGRALADLKRATIHTTAGLNLIHISARTRPERFSYAAFCLKKKPSYQSSSTSHHYRRLPTPSLHNANL